MKGWYIPILIGLMAEISFADDLTVSGKATYDGAPVSGAKVYVYYSDPLSSYPIDLDSRAIQAGRTKSDGSFTAQVEQESLVRDPHREAPCIFLCHPKYAMGWKRIYLDSRMNIEVSDPETIRGIVRDSAGNPVKSARATISGITFSTDLFTAVSCSKIPEMMVNTDSNGEFVLNGLPFGKQKTIVIEAEGFATKREQAASTGQIYSLEPEAIIEGTVMYGDTGKPAKNITVIANAVQNAKSWLAKATTDRHGIFRIYGLSSGTYTVTLSPNDLHPEWVALPATVRVESGKSINGVELKLVSGGFVTGKVTDVGTGEPIRRLIVSTRSTDNTVQPCVTRTDDNGEYRLRSLPGKIAVIVQTPDKYEHTIAQKSVTVIEGKTVSEIDFAFKKGMTLRGRVLFEDGNPAEGVTVGARSKDQFFAINSTVSDSAGRFELYGWKTGAKITVKAKHEERKLQGETEIEVKPDAEAEIRLKPYDTATIRGTILDEAGTPLLNVEIELIVVDQKAGYGTSHVVARTDSSGNYQVNDVIINASSSIFAKKNGYVTHSIKIPDLKVGMLQAETVTMFRADRWIEGIVKDSNGTPIPDARVSINSGPSGYKSSVTDNQGYYRLEGLVTAAESRLSINHRNYGPFGFEYVPTNERSDFMLPQGPYRLSGKVVDESGTPLSRASISIEPQQHQSGRIYPSISTDATGAFQIEYILDDTVTVHIGYEEKHLWSHISSLHLSIDDTTFVLKPIIYTAEDSAKMARPEWEFDKRGAITFDGVPEIKAERWLNGGPVTLADLRGKIVILDFWSSDMPSSVSALRLMRKLKENYGEKGVIVFGVHKSTENFAAVEKALADNKITYPVAIDRKSQRETSGGLTMDSYGNNMYNVIISRDGTITPDVPDSALESVLTGILRKESGK